MLTLICGVSACGDANLYFIWNNNLKHCSIESPLIIWAEENSCITICECIYKIFQSGNNIYLLGSGKKSSNLQSMNENTLNIERKAHQQFNQWLIHVSLIKSRDNHYYICAWFSLHWMNIFLKSMPTHRNKQQVFAI